MWCTQELVDAVKEHLCDDDGYDSLKDVYEHGADAGYPGFTYYSDTCEFFQMNRAAIVQMVKDYADEFGQDAISFVASFQCLTDDAETRDEIGRAIYGQPEEDDCIVQNALAWFALEEAARAVHDHC